MRLSKCEFKKYVYICLALSVVLSLFKAPCLCSIFSISVFHTNQDRVELLPIADGSERPRIVQPPRSVQRNRGEIVSHDDREVSPLHRHQLPLPALPAGQWHSVVSHTLSIPPRSGALVNRRTVKRISPRGRAVG